MADTNGDGVGDLAVGAFCDDDGGVDRGAIYVLFMASTGVVSSFQKVSDTMGSFTGIIFLSFFLHEYSAEGVANTLCCMWTGFMFRLSGQF